MKILQVTTFYYPVVGGVETQVSDLSEKLTAEGHKVEVITTNSARNGNRISEDELAARSKYTEIPVRTVKTHFDFSEFHKFAPGFFKYFLRSDYDLIHVHGIRKPELFLALLAAKLRKKKIVVSSHNPFTTVGRSKVHKLLIAIQDLFLGIPFMRFVDHYFLVTTSEQEEFGKFSIDPKKFHVIGNAVKDDFFVPKAFIQRKYELNIQERILNAEFDNGKLPDELLETLQRGGYQSLVFCTGRMHKVKGFQKLVKAIPALPNSLFYFVGGDDGYLPELKQKFAGMANVYFSEKYYPRETLVEIYKLADIFLSPSLHEPFGIVLLEAMASGTAVLASKQGGPAEILVDFPELLVENNDRELWEAMIKEQLSSSESLSKTALSLRSFVEKYSWDKIIPEYIKIYRK